MFAVVVAPWAVLTTHSGDSTLLASDLLTAILTDLTALYSRQYWHHTYSHSTPADKRLLVETSHDVTKRGPTSGRRYVTSRNSRDVLYSRQRSCDRNKI